MAVLTQDPITPNQSTRNNAVADRLAKKIARMRRKKMKDVRPIVTQKSMAWVNIDRSQLLTEATAASCSASNNALGYKGSNFKTGV